MSVALYMDENVPRAITVGLRLRGIDVLTPLDDGRLGTADPLLLDRPPSWAPGQIGDCVRDLHLIAEASEPQELANRVEFLPLRWPDRAPKIRWGRSAPGGSGCRKPGAPLPAAGAPGTG